MFRAVQREQLGYVPLLLHKSFYYRMLQTL